MVSIRTSLSLTRLSLLSSTTLNTYRQLGQHALINILSFYLFARGLANGLFFRLADALFYREPAPGTVNVICGIFWLGKSIYCDNSVILYN